MLKVLSGPGFYRIMLALMVYVSHMSSLQLGVTGVYVFFSLSGFWISRLWTRKYSRSSRAYFIFVVSRCWRIWPVFIMASAMTWSLFLLSRNGLAPFGDGWHPTGQALVRQVIANIAIFGYSNLPFAAKTNGPMWSLDIEAQFYLVAPLVLVVLARGKVAIGAAVAASLAFILFIHVYAMPRYLIFFIAGMAAERTRWHPSSAIAGAALAGAVMLVVVVSIIPASHGIVFASAANADSSYNHLLSAVLALGLLPWTIFTTRQEAFAHDRKLGDLAFIFYAVHYPILRFFNIGFDGNMKKLGLSALFTAGVCALFFFYDSMVEKRRALWVSLQVKAHPGNPPGPLKPAPAPEYVELSREQFSS